MAKLFLLIMVLFQATVLAVTDAELDDPTKPYFLTKTSGPAKKTKIKNPFKLTAIYLKKNKKQAIINTDLYKLGDHIANKKIIAINFNSVTLLENGKTIVLHLTTSFKKENTQHD